MNKTSLERQADRAERLADNTVDEGMKQILLNAAREYRAQAQKDDREPEAHRVKGGDQTIGDRPHLGWAWSGSSEQLRSATGF